MKESPILSRSDHGQLILNGKSVRVQLCFPWTEPLRYFSLRDSENNEVTLVEDPNSLDESSRSALFLSIQETRFLFEVTQVQEVRAEQELRTWKVVTEQGARSFQTKLDDWPRSVAGDGWILRDVSGDLYLFRELRAMDNKSRELLSAFIDFEPE